MTLAFVSLVVGTAAAIFALLAWLTSRQRQPFTLHRDGNLVRLTRARRPAVQLRRAFVFHRGELGTADFAGTTEWRRLRRDQSLIIDLRQRNFDGGRDSYVPPSEVLTVQYRRLWPWDLEALGATRQLLARRVSGGPKDKTLSHREELDGDYLLPARPWREWRSPML